MMKERPYILTVDIADNGRAEATMMDDGTVTKKVVYDFNREMAYQIIKMQYTAIRENNIKEAEQTGKALTGVVLPREIRERLPETGSALLLSTNEHGIPWELLWDKGFYGVRYAMGRQLLTTGNIKKPSPFEPDKHKSCLILTNPTDDLPEAQEESAKLMEFFRSKGKSCTLVAGTQITSAYILVLLGSGEFDVVHYSGHIEFDENSDAYLKLSGGDRFDLKATLYLDDFGSPFMFLNGCGGGPSFEGSANIAKPLIFAGSGQILCAAMPISDRGGREFSEYIMTNALKGEPYGKAIMDARRNFCFEPGASMDWMSFVFYGNPVDGIILPDHSDKAKIDEKDKKTEKNEKSEESKLSGTETITGGRMSAKGRVASTGNPGEISAALKRVIGRADGLTEDVYIISTSHLFIALLMEHDEQIDNSFKKMGVRAGAVEAYVAGKFGAPADPEIRESVAESRYSPNASKAIEKAYEKAYKEGREVLPRDLFAALLSSSDRDEKNMIVQLLESLNIDCDMLIMLL